MQLYAVVFIIHCKITVHVSGAVCTRHQENIKTVDAITGTSHVSVCCGFKYVKRFLISNFRRVLNAVCFLLGDSPASEFYMPTFRNTLFRLHRQVGACGI